MDFIETSFGLGPGGSATVEMLLLMIPAVVVICRSYRKLLQRPPKA